jgi:hypothetical protein
MFYDLVLYCIRIYQERDKILNNKIKYMIKLQRIFDIPITFILL